MSRYYLAHMLHEGSAKNYQQAVGRQIDELFSLETPVDHQNAHITVHAPFEATDDQICELKKILGSFSQTFCESPKEIPFTIDGYLHFDKSVIALKVAPSARMNLIISTLNEWLKCLPWLTWGEYEPLMNFHITVAKKIPEDMFESIWEHLTKKSNPCFELSLKDLTLLRFEEGAWVVDSVYHLTP